MTRPTLLCILDGFGLNPNETGNAIKLAKTPNFDKVWNESPKTTLITHGNAVGLPIGQMGNSEVGHMHISAGRVINQWLVKIEKALKDKSIFKSDNFKNFINNTADNQINILGLYSTGGVHSHAEHLKLLIEYLGSNLKNQINLHLITDGRDCGPNMALQEIKKLEEFLENYPNVKIATIQGRFFAMDRDKRSEKTEKAWKLIVEGVGTKFDSASKAIEKQYKDGTTDEFLEPCLITPFKINENDSLITFNFRSDRMRQIVSSLALKNGFHTENTKAVFKKENVLCFANYESDFKLPYLFSLEKIENSLGEVISKNGLTQLRIAETEKYPHVTFFFNAGSDEKYPGETHFLIDSPKDVKTYDEKPEMSAYLLKDKIIAEINNNSYNFYVLNFANCDMVGHTGSLDAAIKAVETVDTCLGEILTCLTANNAQAIFIADHGNAEKMIDTDTNTVFTAHTIFPVPMILFGRNDVKLKATEGSLKDVAPTVLELMGIKKPIEMTGNSLIA
jgi:2,3-bisphosphoglycerate-independent phosphoglycerate mutase